MNIYNMAPQEVLAYFNVDLKNGLSLHEVEHLSKKYGPNLIPQKPRPSLLITILHQLQNPLVYLLIIAALIIIALGNYSDAIVTLIVIIFNTIIGTIHEINAHKTLESLKRLLKVSALVIRDSKKIIVDASDIVPGDILIVSEGDQVPADARLIQEENISINESSLTGESTNVRKTNNAIIGQKGIFDQSNMIFKGTTVASGSGYAVVTATGAQTEFGKIQKATIEHEEPSPLQLELGRLSHWIIIFVIGLCALLLVIGFLANRPLTELFTLITALFIGVVPEGLPIVFAVALAAGAKRLALRHVLVKRLPAAEGLGRVDVIVTDKTGTLTRNEMMVQKIFGNKKYFNVTGQGYFPTGDILYQDTKIDLRDPFFIKLRDAAHFLDTSERQYKDELKGYHIKGEPTEAALGVFAEKIGKTSHEYTKIFDSPFDFKTRLRMSFVRAADKKLIIFVSGAPESVFLLCHNITSAEQQALQTFLAEGLRSVAVAMLEVNEPSQPINWIDWALNYKGKYEFVALIGIEDAIRSDVIDSVLQARQAGVAIIMATGDHKTTATHIATKTGILQAGDIAVSGQELREQNILFDSLDWDKIKVFARVTPQDKLEIIDILKKRGKIVAMTGDGINDIPPIVASSVGIAMGSGTDATKEAADLVLIDNSFANIVSALVEGRHIFATLRRVIWYFFSTNSCEILIILYAFFMNLPLPLRAAQLLWLNVVTDGFLDIGLIFEPVEKGLLSPRWSYLTGKKLISASLLSKVFVDSLTMTIASIWLFLHLYKIDFALAQTMLIVCLAMFQWFNAWNCRSETESLFKKGMLSNKPLIVATLIVFALQLLVVYAPPLQYLFKTIPLTIPQWFACALIASSIIVVEEARKAFIGWWYGQFDEKSK